MRICLITNVYPANGNKDVESAYLTELASGLDARGHEVTVLCAKSNTKAEKSKIRVVVAAPCKKLSTLRLSKRTMPGSLQFASRQLGFWQAFFDLGGGDSFDVVETGQSHAGALLGAFSREMPCVLRVVTREKTDGEDFDLQFQKLISSYAYACIDLFSCASPEEALYLQQVKKIEPALVTVNSSQNQGDLAAHAISIYESAIQRFAHAKKPQLYRHGAQKLIKSTEDMILLYERMLYDLLFRVSYRFRVGHWLHLMRSNPRALASKVLQRFSQKV